MILNGDDLTFCEVGTGISYADASAVLGPRKHVIWARLVLEPYPGKLQPLVATPSLPLEGASHVDIEKWIVTYGYQKATVGGDKGAIHAIGERCSGRAARDRRTVGGAANGDAVDSLSAKLVIGCGPGLDGTTHLFDNAEHVATRRATVPAVRTRGTWDADLPGGPTHKISAGQLISQKGDPIKAPGPSLPFPSNFTRFCRFFTNQSALTRLGPPLADFHRINCEFLFFIQHTTSFPPSEPSIRLFLKLKHPRLAKSEPAIHGGSFQPVN
ncbi:hypothetical protein NUW58_g10287 [Xylaria curta]|uniref:Uncharacterized protein n=1 Tax=Xylaria curta TaxID=42375 RepID=A0ACC1MPD4_9PEZI|nr:hypothetical protein NUW58_g10287 [Xylaria curta]